MTLKHWLEKDNNVKRLANLATEKFSIRARSLAALCTVFVLQNGNLIVEAHKEKDFINFLRKRSLIRSVDLRRTLFAACSLPINKDTLEKYNDLFYIACNEFDDKTESKRIKLALDVFLFVMNHFDVDFKQWLSKYALKFVLDRWTEIIHQGLIFLLLLFYFTGVNVFHVISSLSVLAGAVSMVTKRKANLINSCH